jgi:hypothetical protein
MKIIHIRYYSDNCEDILINIKDFIILKIINKGIRQLDLIDIKFKNKIIKGKCCGEDFLRMISLITENKINYVLVNIFEDDDIYEKWMDEALKKDGMIS